MAHGRAGRGAAPRRCGAGLIVGLGVGWLTGSRWSVLVAPIWFVLVYEIARLPVDGPTVDGLRLSTYGVIAFVTARLFHGHDTLAWAEDTGQADLVTSLRQIGPPPYADPRNYEISLSHEMEMYPQLQGIDFRETATSFDIPMFFVQGAHEAPGRAEVFDDWYPLVDAPVKDRVLLDTSGHRPLFEQPQEFTDYLTEVVLPRTSP